MQWNIVWFVIGNNHTLIVHRCTPSSVFTKASQRTATASFIRCQTDVQVTETETGKEAGSGMNGIGIEVGATLTDVEEVGIREVGEEGIAGAVAVADDVGIVARGVRGEGMMIEEVVIGEEAIDGITIGSTRGTTGETTDASAQRSGTMEGHIGKGRETETDLQNATGTG